MKILLLGPDSRNARIKSFLMADGHTVEATTDKITLDFLRASGVDLIICSGYQPIIKEPIISEYDHKIINFHNSYLPYGRGVFPVVWSFLEGAPNGVSIHFIDQGIDTGDIIAQRKVQFSDHETLRIFHNRLMTELEKLFFDNWQRILDQDHPVIRQQDLGIETRYHSRVDSERVMDLLPKRWDTPLVEVADLAADLSLSGQFWEAHDAEIRDLVTKETGQTSEAAGAFKPVFAPNPAERIGR